MVTEALKASGVRLSRPDQVKKDILEFHKGEDGRAPRLRHSRRPGAHEGQGQDGQPRGGLLSGGESGRAQGAALRGSRPLAPDTQPGRLPHGGSDADGPASSRASASAPSRPHSMAPARRGHTRQGPPWTPGQRPLHTDPRERRVRQGRHHRPRRRSPLTKEAEGSYYFRVVPFRDSSIDVSVSPGLHDRLPEPPVRARARTAPRRGSSPRCPGRQGSCPGIDPKAVAEAVAACRAGKTILRKPVAAGRQARPAGAPRWLWARWPGLPLCRSEARGAIGAERGRRYAGPAAGSRGTARPSPAWTSLAGP